MPETGGVAFDFLDAELVRLKDIGQRNTCLLTASSAAELSLVRPDGVLSVMTFHMIDSLARAKGPVEIAGLHRRTEDAMRQYFESDAFRRVSKQRESAGKKPLKPHHPKLFNHTGSPVWIKP